MTLPYNDKGIRQNQITQQFCFKHWDTYGEANQFEISLGNYQMSYHRAHAQCRAIQTFRSDLFVDGLRR